MGNVEAVDPDVELVPLDVDKWMIRRAGPHSGSSTVLGFIHTHHGMHEALSVGATPTHVYAPTFDRALQLVLHYDGAAAHLT